MTAIQIVGLIAAIALLLFAFFKVFQFIVRSWKAIEAEEAKRRRCPSLRKRGGVRNPVTGSEDRLKI
jgi:hypothetical protein